VDSPIGWRRRLSGLNNSRRLMSLQKNHCWTWCNQGTIRKLDEKKRKKEDSLVQKNSNSKNIYILWDGSINVSDKQWKAKYDCDIYMYLYKWQKSYVLLEKKLLYVNRTKDVKILHGMIHVIMRILKSAHSDSLLRRKVIRHYLDTHATAKKKHYHVNWNF
jgi:hypothetical protein